MKTRILILTIVALSMSMISCNKNEDPVFKSALDSIPFPGDSTYYIPDTIPTPGDTTNVIPDSIPTPGDSTTYLLFNRLRVTPQQLN